MNRRKRRKQTTIDDLPENVIYDILKNLTLKSFTNFLLAYPKVGSIHGVYTLFMKTQRSWISRRRRAIIHYESQRDNIFYHWCIEPEYRWFMNYTKIKNIRWINKLLRYIHNSANSHYNDLICRRSIRLKERKDLLDVPFLVVLSDGNIFLRR